MSPRKPHIVPFTAAQLASMDRSIARTMVAIGAVERTTPEEMLARLDPELQESIRAQQERMETLPMGIAPAPAPTDVRAQVLAAMGIKEEKPPAQRYGFAARTHHMGKIHV